MPTAFRAKGYRFFFFSLEGSERLHVHVEKAGAYAKFWLEPVSLARNRGFRSHELTEIRKLVEANRAMLEEKWDEHLGH